MKLWEVKRVIEITNIVYADTRQEALDAFNEINAATKLLKETAKCIPCKDVNLSAKD